MNGQPWYNDNSSIAKNLGGSGIKEKKFFYQKIQKKFSTKQFQKGRFIYQSVQNQIFKEIFRMNVGLPDLS